MSTNGNDFKDVAFGSNEKAVAPKRKNALHRFVHLMIWLFAVLWLLGLAARHYDWAGWSDLQTPSVDAITEDLEETGPSKQETCERVRFIARRAQDIYNLNTSHFRIVELDALITLTTRDFEAKYPGESGTKQMAYLLHGIPATVVAAGEMQDSNQFEAQAYSECLSSSRT